MDVFKRCKARIAIFSGSKRAMSNAAALKNVPVLALRSKQCFDLTQVVAKIVPNFVVKLAKGLPLPAFHASFESILADNAIHI